MKVSINAVHFRTDSKLEDFINDKLGKMNGLFDGIVGSDVTLKLENSESPENKVVEIRLAIRGNDLYARKQCKTFEEATDQSIEALKKQLQKYKDKKRGL
ncbi:MAG: ribosome-associated translation inhibitor RaiA [Bacteroidales bacterium]|jgi:putative sigma-54 modulation protein|nr:ribosome-associated translation inhibitor RaiA [Bacteroidales bacterium]